MASGGMKALFVYLVLLQCTRVSGASPLFSYSFRPVVDFARRVSLTELNRRAASPYLFRSNRPIVQQISEVGFNTFDVDLGFGVRQSVCTEIYLDRCATMWSPSAVTATCSSRVRVSAGYAQLLALHCVTDSSSSESSSSSSEEEEVLVRVGVRISVQVPSVVLCRGAASCARLLW